MKKNNSGKNAKNAVWIDIPDFGKLPVATTIPQRNKEKKEGSQICTYPIHFGDLLEGVKLIIDVFWSNSY